MKFGKFLAEKQREEWAAHYLNYKALKDLVKEAAKEMEEAGPQAYSPRTTSLTVLRAMDRRDNAEERFFQLLEAEVDKVGRFTAQVVEGLRERLFLLQSRAREALSPEENNLLVAEAKTIGDEFLALEKFVNLNYMGFHKILKKHDKNLPQTPCRQFYISHLHNQPWVQGNYSDLLVALSNVYADLRGDVAPSDGAVDLDDEGYRYITSKYWVKMGDVSSVKHHILQHLPVYQFSENEYTGDSQLVNSVYLDNTSLEIYHALLNERPNGVEIRITWLGSQEPSEVTVDRKYKRYNAKGEEDVESFVLPEQMVVGFLEGDLSAALAKAYWSSKGLSSDDIQHNVELFDEVQRLVDAKQLKPLVRTQFMRTLFQIPFHPTVRIKLDTNINMMKENPEDGPTLGLAGRWYRDPALPVHRTEVTRFPHAVVELDLALEKGETTPDWVAELVESGLLWEIDNFSKPLHGTSTLFPDMIQALPYWVDDESVRASMLLSAPEQAVEVSVTARDQLTTGQSKPRKGFSADDPLRVPLLQRNQVSNDGGVTRPRRRRVEQSPIGKFVEWWFSKPAMAPRPKIPGAIPEKSEPKTYLANERTFLAWLHMALTIGSIAAAMIGVSASSGSTKTAASDQVGLIALILLPVALFITGYALLVYHWRTEAIAQKTDLYYDDRRGPFALTIIITAALSSIFLLSLADLLRSVHRTSPPSEPASTWLQQTMVYRLLGP